jgi:ABC-type glycerol-3-phosphate transport system substrate-binding protein
MQLGTKLRALVVALSIGLSACTALKEGMEDSQRTSSALKSELGLDALVIFRTINGHTTVDVRLATPPAGNAATAKAQITDVVTRNFRVKVEHVNVSF